MLRKTALIVCALFAMVGFAQAQNASQTPVSNSDCSVQITTTGTWQQVLKTNTTRKALLLANNGANTMGILFTSISNGNVAPAVAINGKGVYPFPVGWSYEPDGGFIWAGEVWVIGTAGDVLTCGNN